ncbi:MAG: biotin/lipoyl-binding protein [Chloroflexi bacterium]|nr:MAG: biotin/lipoyl-binding protein [Chloroflexota bacterium]
MIDGNRHSVKSVEALTREEQCTAESISIEQLQRLVWLLDKSDVSEIEVKRAEEGTHLVLRKAKITGNVAFQVSDVTIVAAESEAPVETTYRVVASLVGIFHSWAKPRGGALVAVGDHVKVGQLIGTIQSLNVMNDVECAVAGCVAEVLVQDGQPVEYGQPLMIIETKGEG